MKALVERKGGFSASTVFPNVGTMCVTSGAIIRAQRIQIETKAKEDTKKLKKKEATKDKRLASAQLISAKSSKGETLTARDLKIVIMYVSPGAKYIDLPS